MRFSRVLAILPVVAATITTTPAAQQQTPAGTAVVVGRVVEMVTNTPVGGASVTLATAAVAPVAGAPAPPSPSAPARRVVAVTNDDGRFVIRDVPGGTYTITAAFPGLASGAYGQRRPAGPSRPITVADGAREPVVIPMWRLGAISGTVRDDRGEPATGVYVNVLRRVMNNGRVELTFTGGGGEAVDDRGRFRVSNLVPGTYAVTVNSALRTNAVADLDAYYASAAAGTVTPLLLRFRETGVLNITDNTGALVIGEWQLSTSNGDPRPLPGPDGTALVHPNLFYPGARTSGGATLITIGPGTERDGVDLTLPLVPGMRVSGTLTGPDGPAVNYGLRIAPVSTGDPAFEIPIGYAVTDTRGRFAFLGVPSGAYVIRAYRIQPSGPLFIPPAAGGPPGTRVEAIEPSASPLPWWFGELAVTVGSSHVDGLAMMMQPGARVSGRVVFEGDTPPPAAARLQQVVMSIRPQFGLSEGPPNEARANAQAQFATQGFAPGRYVVQTVTSPGPEWTLASIRFGTTDVVGQAFTIGTQDVGDVTITFTDKTITLAGEVRAAESGPTEATVVLFPADHQAWVASGMSPRRTAVAVTSPTGGAYQLRVPLPGEYLVVAIPPDIAPEIDGEFAKRFSAAGVRVSLAAGDAKTQALTVARVR